MGTLGKGIEKCAILKAREEADCLVKCTTGEARISGALKRKKAKKRSGFWKRRRNNVPRLERYEGYGASQLHGEKNATLPEKAKAYESSRTARERGEVIRKAPFQPIITQG